MTMCLSPCCDLMIIMIIVDIQDFGGCTVGEQQNTGGCRSL